MVCLKHQSSAYHFFFFFHIIDLPYVVHDCQVDLYADGTSILCSAENSFIKIKKSLDNAIDWFIDNNLTLNSKKCEILSFGRKKNMTVIHRQLLISKVNNTAKSLVFISTKNWSLMNM